jgi:3-methyladenine DNA glycosylase AlkD
MLTFQLSGWQMGVLSSRVMSAVAEEILEELRALADPLGKAGMTRFGIETSRALGVSMTKLRQMATRLGRDHALAAGLWRSGIHEARILASIVDVPAEVTAEQMESWAAEFDSWDLVDQCCGNLFCRTPHAWTKAVEWAGRDEEFVKRAGFSLMAYLAVHAKAAPDESLAAFLPVIEREAADGRNFVKKAVNWALRQIGKRNSALNQAAIEAAERIHVQGSPSARWIASDALRELKARRPPP